MKTLWEMNKPLTFTGLLMLAVLVFSLAGLMLDPRTITGAPAWLKPTKFAVSTAIYSLTLVWIFRYLADWPRTRAWVGWITSVVLIVEVGIIDVQAARGVTSHFNLGTRLDAALFGIMGAGIVFAWLASIAVVVALFRQRFDDASLGWALRIGMLITVLGAGTGGLMTQPTPPQLEEAHRTGRLRVVGAHTVGAPDGGPGMPGTGWSREHGDLRVPHFFGMHAMQVLPLFALLIGRGRPRLVVAAGLSYGVMFLLLVAQALAGKPFLGGVI